MKFRLFWSGMFATSLALGVIVPANEAFSTVRWWSCTEYQALASAAQARGDISGMSRYLQQYRSCTATGSGAAIASSLSACSTRYNSLISGAMSRGDMAGVARWRAALNDCRTNTTNALNAATPTPAPLPVAPPAQSIPDSQVVPTPEVSMPPESESEVGVWVAGVSISAPSEVGVNREIEVVASFTDNYGAAVAIGVGQVVQGGLVIQYSGPGLVLDGFPSSTDLNGQLRFRVRYAPNDQGVASVQVGFVHTSPPGDNAQRIMNTVFISVRPQVTEIEEMPNSVRGWTTMTGPREIKMYTRQLVGAGKVQFFHNGREVAWVNASNQRDRKLNLGGDGMVRTVRLDSGRNVLEIYVDGERIVRRIATG